MSSHCRMCCCAALAAAMFFQGSSAWAQRPRTLQTDAEQAAEQKVVERLKQPVDAHFREQPLASAMEKLALAADVTIRLDIKALEDASIGPDMPVTYDAKKTTLKAALKSLLGPLDLIFVVKNEAILVTTPEKAGNELITKVYPVHDLVAPGQVNRRFSGYQPLIDLITSTIAPTTWDEVGGPGAIHEFRASGALVVSQTFEVHESIEPLLGVLRRVRDDQHIPHEKQPLAARNSLAPARRAMPQSAGDRPAAVVLMAPQVYD